MRDAFLVFLLVLAVALLGGYAWFARWTLHRLFTADDGLAGGCGLWLALISAGLIAVPTAVTLIGIVGHSAGVDMTQLTSGW